MNDNQMGFFRFSNYVYWLIILNILFVVANSILFAALITLIPTISNAILYYIAFIPTGPPALAALFHSLRLAKEKDLSPVQVFWGGHIRKTIRMF